MENDNKPFDNKARLTRELTREKERALAEQSENYESKIAGMKEKAAARKEKKQNYEGLQKSKEKANSFLDKIKSSAILSNRTKFNSKAFRKSFSFKTRKGFNRNIPINALGVQTPTRRPVQRLPIKLQQQIQRNPMNFSNTNIPAATDRYEQEKKLRLQQIQTQNNSLSPSATSILSRLMKIQTSGNEARARAARLSREKKIILDSSNILRTPSLFSGKQDINLTLCDTEHSILSAPNIFRELPDNKIMDMKGKPSILETGRAGNTLSFFGNSILKNNSRKEEPLKW